MRWSRRALCVVLTALFLTTTAATVSLCEPDVPAEGEFERLLAQAGAAHRAGRPGEARARLRDAARLVSEDERFHGLLADAGDEYDQGKLRASRARLKTATRIVNPWLWLGVGFVGQVFFTMRFLVQWLASERKRASVVPITFWYFSILGSLHLLSYAIWRQDPIIILGQSFNSLIYVRNLMFIYRARRCEGAAAEESEGSA